MKKILFIAHHFPPMGGPGTHRSLHFVKYLLKFNYQPYILTIPLNDIRHGLYPIDNELLEQVPKEIPICRVATGGFRKLKNILIKLRVFRLFWFLLYPFFWESCAFWPFRALRPAEKIINNNGIKIIYTSSGPFSSMVLGYLLKKQLNVRWVADLRDPFTDGYMWLFPSKIHWYFARYFEKTWLAYADKVIVNTPEVKRLYLSRKLVSPEKIEVITNGF